MGTGTLEDALAWVEYCNSSANTYYANLRRKNGHEQPHNVKVGLFSLSVTSPDLITLAVLVARKRGLGPVARCVKKFLMS